jgi:glucoamylase
MMKTWPCIVFGLAVLAACGADPAAPTFSTVNIAPGAPGSLPTWSNAQKTGIGTSYEAYDAGGQFSDQSPTAPLSKVWFSIGQDRITEVMWGLIHEAQIREIRFVLVGPEGVIEPESVSVRPVKSPDRSSGIDAPLHVIEQSYQAGVGTLRVSTFTDPDNQTLVTTLDLQSDRDDLSVFAYIDPALGNSGIGDRAYLEDRYLYAETEGAALAITGDTALDGSRSVGFVGVSDDLPDLVGGTSYQDTGATTGNVALLTEVPLARDGARQSVLYFGFGENTAAARQAAAASAARGAPDILADYTSGWRTYLDSLEHLEALSEVSKDQGALAYMSAINLKVMEDKTHAGALIASLSNPWGETAPAVQSQTGYKAVWPRDFFQVASAFVAMGDEETARAAYRYLPTVQVTEQTPGNSGVTGWFLQKTHVDGEIEWVAIQQDQTAMPIMLGWKLWQEGVLSDQEMAASYRAMLKPAADFLVAGGRPNILWNTEFEASLGYTQQERWEEQEGYSPSTVAAVIAGLVTAADLAEQFGESADAERYLEAADLLEANIENWMFTNTGDLGDGDYFIRVTRNKDPNDKAKLGDNNGRPGLPEDHVVDGGFLELVRYGVRAWNAPSILATLGELDGAHEDNLRVRYEFEDGGLGWRRYGNDGYGEDGISGTNYHEIEGGNTLGQRGRVWPFFSGERAHYEIAKRSELASLFGPKHPNLVRQDADIRRLAHSMEGFANEGLSLPEQVWDGVGPNPFGYELGEGTNTATPLAWTHAEYVKLLRSIADGEVWDRYEIVEARYGDSPRNQPVD